MSVPAGRTSTSPSEKSEISSALKCSMVCARSRQAPEVCETYVDARRGSTAFQFLALISCHSKRSNCSAPVAFAQVLALGGSQHPVSTRDAHNNSSRIGSRARMVGDCNPAGLVVEFLLDIGPEFLEDVPSHIGGDAKPGSTNGVAGRAAAARVINRTQRGRRRRSQKFRSIKGGMAGVGAGHKDPRHGIANARACASLPFAEISRIGTQQSWEEESLKDVTTGFIGNRCPEALGIAFAAVAPLWIWIARLRDAGTHRRASNPERVDRIEGSNLQLAARRQRLIGRWRVGNRGIAGVLLRVAGRSLLRAQTDAAAGEDYPRDQSHSVSIQEKEVAE